MSALPYEIVEAMIQCFGLSFHYKDAVEQFLRSAGVSRELVVKYKHEPKFVWARHVLSELSETEDGQLLQRKLLTQLCNLKNLPDPGVQDRDQGLDALRRLKELARDNDLFAVAEQRKSESRQSQAETRLDIIRERAAKLEDLHLRFSKAVVSIDRQEAGYSLEDFLKELFALSEIEYRKSYRTPTQQIDGYFRLEGFDYLVEAKWRKDQPTEQEIGGFKHKVDSKMESTRGLFVCVQGVRDEVVDRFQVPGANIIFMDGEDLTHILEGRFDLKDALRLKIEKAAQEGRVFAPLREHMTSR